MQNSKSLFLCPFIHKLKVHTLTVMVYFQLRKVFCMKNLYLHLGYPILMHSICLAVMGHQLMIIKLIKE